MGEELLNQNENEYELLAVYKFELLVPKSTNPDRKLSVKKNVDNQVDAQFRRLARALKERIPNIVILHTEKGE